MRYVTAILLMGFIYCCSRQNTPEDLLKTYITKRFAGESNKRGLTKYLNGPLLEEVERMSPDEFDEFTEFGNKKLTRIDIELTKCEETWCNITYSIRYRVKEGKDIQHGVEVKKIARVDLIDGEGWKISNISNVKSFIKAQGINLP